MSFAEKQTEAAKYELSRQYHTTVWSSEIDLDGESKPQLLFNTQRMQFCLPVTSYKQEGDSQFLPIIGVLVLGRASILCPLFQI
jgi:hypothetical protein